MIRNGIILLLLLTGIPATAGAAELYLKDGGIIECILAKHQGATVYVLVNRFTEIELDRSEVAIRKTFGRNRSIGTIHRHKKRVCHR